MPTHVVQIFEDRFEPARIQVYRDDSVVWRNNDAAGHSATADSGEFDTGIILSGQIAGKVIIQPVGAISYHDSSAGFRGEIVVTIPKDHEK